MTHGRGAKFRRAAMRAEDPAVLRRRLAYKEDELEEKQAQIAHMDHQILGKQAELVHTQQVLGLLAVHHAELLALMRDERLANKRSMEDAIRQAQPAHEFDEDGNIVSAFVFSWALDRKMSVKVGHRRVNVLELLLAGAKVMIWNGIQLATEARSIRASGKVTYLMRIVLPPAPLPRRQQVVHRSYSQVCLVAVHTLVIAFDAIATARALGFYHEDAYDAAVSVVHAALGSSTPIPVHGAPKNMYLHTASAIHAKMPTAQRGERTVMLWGSAAAAASQGAESWLHTASILHGFPVCWLGTDSWDIPDVCTVARQSTGVTGMAQVSVLKVVPASTPVLGAKRARV